ncbi:hypothetical protein AG1IA_03505 [Rhizoctonia solani AG-1 IA]|uniref:Uncharacterized protein n=1 Tax=Thanatephorus cucumeris (strain AG1-IA) TaxID=983506 RepID=L8WWV8_THACA|nr:hypothetical protein AG1IA_03505 [Rhizoctonia solani AG-1 IA]
MDVIDSNIPKRSDDPHASVSRVNGYDGKRPKAVRGRRVPIDNHGQICRPRIHRSHVTDGHTC